MARKRGCMFSSVSFSRQAFENVFELRFENFERLGDRDFYKFDSEVAGEAARVVDAAAGRSRGWAWKRRLRSLRPVHRPR